MKKYIALLVISLLGVGVAFSQQNLTVSSLVGTNVDTILQRHLAGDGVEISTGKFNNQTGNVQSAQIGTFNRNQSSFPFQRGLVMTTGNVSVAAGPNSGGSNSSTSGVNSYTDSQLSSLISGVQNSAALEFDFVAYADTFSFNYIFASEEYPEYACSSYNDVFAFFLTGIDPVTFQTTTKNVAIIPGTITASNPSGVPVTINSINAGPGTSGSSGNCTPPGSSAPYSSFYVGNPSGVEYDGHTTALAASATILACQTYHMKMAVGNVTDNGWDSGVFLEEGSFYSPQVSIEKTWQNNIVGGDTLVQNCRELDLLFKLPRPAFTGNISVIIDPRGTAVLGQDYVLTKPNGELFTSENNEFFYQPGTDTQNVHVRILPEAHFTQDSPLKTAILYISTQRCAGREDTRLFDTITLYLRANDSVRLLDKEVTVCDRLENIEVEQVRGTAPNFYEWIPTTGITHPDQLSTECNITASGTYKLIARDMWGCMCDTATVRVTVVPKPEFTVTYTPDHGCMPLPVTLQAQYTPDYAALYWTISQDSTFFYTDSTITIHTSLDIPGYYDISLLVESAPGCSDSISYSNAIHVSDFPHAEFTFSPEEPENGEEVFFYNHSTGENITNYAWSFGDGHSSYIEEPSHVYHLTESDLMTVHLTVTNSDGCSGDTVMTVPVEDNFAFFVPNSFTPNNDGKNDIFLPKVSDVVNYELTIYARTGELIFYTTNPEEGWDGFLKEAPAPQGVYVWKINYAKIGTPNEMMVRNGTVTLVR
jgi:gliding motility-associated-like protein